MKTATLYAPTTIRDVFRRSAIRIGFCAVPYFAIAWLWSIDQDARLFRGIWFFWCVVVIPGAGLALDIWRLRHTPDTDRKSGDPEN